MVDALHEARRILVRRGRFVDARPDSRVAARLRHGSPRGRILGTIATQRPTLTDDRTADRAVNTVVGEKLLRSVRHGRLWHAIPFEDLIELGDYLNDHLRFSHRVSWRVPKARRTGPFFLERAIRFEIFERMD
jgi:hypothetical protein